MRILLEKNEKLKYIQESMSSVKDIEILEGDILEDNNNLKYDLLIVYCDTIEDINKYKDVGIENVLIVTNNKETKFLYTAIMMLKPLDIIGIDLNMHALYIRISSNIEFLRENNL